MPAAAVGVAAAASIAQGVGQRRAAKQQNRYMSQLYSPENIMARARGINPWLFGALAGQAGTTPYQQELWKIASQPGYIDPRVMNAQYTQSAQQQQADLQRARAMLGTSDIGGNTGLGQAYAMANLAARTGRDVQLGQQYNLAREQQRRADLDWLSGQVSNAQQAAMQGAGAIGSTYQQPPSWLSTGAGAVQAGLTAYGGMQGMARGGGGPIPTGQWGQGPTLPALNSPQWQQSPYPNLQYTRLS